MRGILQKSASGETRSELPDNGLRAGLVIGSITSAIDDTVVTVKPWGG
jgi:hypothetical protein